MSEKGNNSMTHLKESGESQDAGYMIEWQPRKSAKWRAWVSYVLTECQVLKALRGQRSQHRGTQFRIVKITKTPMEEAK